MQVAGYRPFNYGSAIGDSAAFADYTKLTPAEKTAIDEALESIFKGRGAMPAGDGTRARDYLTGRLVCGGRLRGWAGGPVTKEGPPAG